MEESPHAASSGAQALTDHLTMMATGFAPLWYQYLERLNVVLSCACLGLTLVFGIIRLYHYLKFHNVTKGSPHDDQCCRLDPPSKL